jgi:hypothetical protein
MPYSFEVPFEEVRANLDAYVDEVFLNLQSEFMTLPKVRTHSRFSSSVRMNYSAQPLPSGAGRRQANS